MSNIEGGDLFQVGDLVKLIVHNSRIGAPIGTKAIVTDVVDSWLEVEWLDLDATIADVSWWNPEIFALVMRE